LNAAPRSHEPATAVETALRSFIRKQWHIPSEFQTTNELTGALMNAGVNAASVSQLVAILDDCQRSRFADNSAAIVPVDDAKAWILATAGDA